MTVVAPATAQPVIHASVYGKRDPDKLAAMHDVYCKESLETIRNALVGNYRPEHLFTLKQVLARYDFYQQCIDEFDAEKSNVRSLASKSASRYRTSRSQSQVLRQAASDPTFNLRTAMYQLTGTDSAGSCGRRTEQHRIWQFLPAPCGTNWHAKAVTRWLPSARSRCCSSNAMRYGMD
ncbi:hypothetical protein [Massilia consociata]